MYPWSQTFVSIPPVFQQGKFPVVGLQDLLAEISLIDCCEKTAIAKAGPLTLHALNQIADLYEMPIRHAREKGLSSVIEAHVHRLLPGQYPATPGWQCSGVPRRMYNGQPCFDLIQPEQFSVTVTLSSEARGVSNTEYVNHNLKPKIWDKDNVYKDLDIQVEKMHPDTVHGRDGVYAWCSPKTIQRPGVCKSRGVRLWVRMSMFPKPALFNAVGVPEQVYIG